MKKQRFERIDLEWGELQAILEQARSAPLGEEQIHKFKAVLTTLEHLTRELEKKRTSISRLRKLLFGSPTEKIKNVLAKGKDETSGDGGPGDDKDIKNEGQGKKKKRRGHGRNGADSYSGAKRVKVPHEVLKSGDPCPKIGCTGKVYNSVDAGVLVRITGMPPIQATVYELEKLRCNLCGTVFTATAPEGSGNKKYDEAAASMLACLRYGAGFPMYRLAKLEGNLGIPLPAATQWDTLNARSQLIAPAYRALVDTAAQGEVLHNDDTTARILELMAENKGKEGPSDTSPKRKGMFTTGVVAKNGDHRIALFFTGRKHAGENLHSVLKKRSAELDSPIQMCDALSRNLPGEFKTILGNCLSHGRRRFVDEVENFPEECRYPLEILAKVYGNDAVAREQEMSPEERLLFHQKESEPLMRALHEWLERQFANKIVEPNSGLGEAISYMLKHWDKLTLFLRMAGAPLDNNICLGYPFNRS
ncbi:MAG: transposase [Gammaproteobacteria bacterium]|nr:transposase [Gammaproteobacteria bacterium]